MDSDKADVDVSELLKQLEELKKKKAQNVKKLKKKLSRNVVLNQSISSIEHAISNANESVNKNFSVEPNKTISRNVLSEFNCEKSHAVAIQSSTLCPEIKCYDEFSIAHIDSKQSSEISNSVSQLTSINTSLENDLTVIKKTSSICEHHGKEQCNSSHNDINVESGTKSEQISSRKRSVDALQNESSSNNSFVVNKKTKLLKGVFNKTVENHVININNNPLSVVSGIDNSEAIKEDCYAENDSEILFSSQLNKVQERNSINLYGSPKSQFVCKDDKQLLKQPSNGIADISKDSFFPNFDSASQVFSQIDSVPEDKQIEVCQISVDKEVKDVSVVSETVYFESNTECLVESAVIETGKNKDSCSKSPVQNGATNIIEKKSKDLMDSIITEIAETEKLFDLESHLNACPNKKSKNNIISEVSSGKDISNDYNNEVFNSISPTAEKNNTDIKSQVACFAEIRTEQPKPPPTIPKFSNTNEKVLEDCIFTDDEGDDTKYIDSDEINAMFNSEEEENCHGFEDKNSEVCKDANDMPEPDQCTNAEGLESFAVGSEVLIIPETEVFDFASYNESQVDDIGQNVSVSTDNTFEHKINIEDERKISVEATCFNSEVSKEIESDIHNLEIDCENEVKITKCEKLEQDNCHPIENEIVCSEWCTETEFDTDSLKTEEFLKLVNMSETVAAKSNLTSSVGVSENETTNIKFQCCLQSDIKETVTKIKLATFNNSQYLFILHVSWIQVWRLEEESGWNKIFAHQAEALEMQELCLSTNGDYLVLVMLLSSQVSTRCLQFLVFERESRLIKLMEHTHWFENSCEDEDVLLCGLEDLKFAVAHGKESYQVYTHSFSCLDNSPKLLTISLGSTSDILHSICTINKLPNALLGMSNNMLYVWHLLEARLVTSVQLQIDDPTEVESCIWATIENGLVFLIALCGMQENNSEACQLLAVNLATGFCEVACSYSLQPAQDMRLPSNKKINAVYCEPFIAAICNEGAYIWSIDETYCCAALKPASYDSLAIVPMSEDCYLIVIGCIGGCVNCYKLNCQK